MNLQQLHFQFLSMNVDFIFRNLFEIQNKNEINRPRPRRSMW